MMMALSSPSITKCIGMLLDYGKVLTESEINNRIVEKD